jgi:hypothetical protein
MKYHDVIQYSPEFWEIRKGIPTASCFDRILTPKKGELSSQADDYAAELIADIACLSPPFFTERSGHTEAMRNGINCEPEARRFYEFERGVTVTNGGFCLTDDGRFGASPDGLIGDDGALELKCPLLKTQAKYLIGKTLPTEYKVQVHGQLLVTGRKWVDFLSYSPGLAPLLIRVTPDAFTDKLSEALDQFWEIFMEIKKKLLPDASEDSQSQL